jgi:hypothetical protein
MLRFLPKGTIMKHLFSRLLVLATIITLQSSAMDQENSRQTKDQTMIQLCYDSIHQRGPLSLALVQLVAARKLPMNTMPTTPPLWQRTMPVSPP